LNVIPAKAGIQYFSDALDAGSVIPGLIWDRHNEFGFFKVAASFSDTIRQTAHHTPAPLEGQLSFSSNHITIDFNY